MHRSEHAPISIRKIIINKNNDIYIYISSNNVPLAARHFRDRTCRETFSSEDSFKVSWRNSKLVSVSAQFSASINWDLKSTRISTGFRECGRPIENQWGMTVKDHPLSFPCQLTPCHGPSWNARCAKLWDLLVAAWTCGKRILKVPVANHYGSKNLKSWTRKSSRPSCRQTLGGKWRCSSVRLPKGFKSEQPHGKSWLAKHDLNSALGIP